MRPIKLKIAGLNSFKAEQEIDFARLSDLGIFGIFGPTGSGKSTILDAMTLALYGTVVRAGKSKKDIMNHAENQLQVSFAFSLGAAGMRTVYRVDKAYRREKDGVTVKNLHSRLLELGSDGERVLAEREGEVNAAIVRLLGLRLEDFTRAVVLPQGSFASFLRLDGSSRREMLERLFSLEKYGRQLNDKLSLRHGAVSARLNQLEGEQRGLGDASPQTLEAVQAAHVQAVDAAAAAAARLAAATNAYEQAQHILTLQQELAVREADLTGLRLRQEAVAQMTLAVERAEQANLVMPLLAEQRTLSAALRQAEDDCRETDLLSQTLAEHSRQAAAALQLAKSQRAEDEPALMEQKARLSAACEQETVISRLEQQSRELLQRLDADAALLAATEAQLAVAATADNSLSREISEAEQQLQSAGVGSDYRRLIQAAGSLAERLERELAAWAVCREELQLRRRRMSDSETALRTALSTSRAADTAMAQLAETEQAAQAQPHGDEAAISQSELRLAGLKSLLPELAQQQQGLAAEQTAIRGYQTELAAAEAAERQAASACQAARQALAVHESESEASRKAAAAELALTLRSGFPCPVCGSPQHPAPAAAAAIASGEQRQTAVALSEAQAAAAACDDALRRAEAATALYRSRLGLAADRLAAMRSRLEEKMAMLAADWNLAAGAGLDDFTVLAVEQERQLQRQKATLETWRQERSQAEKRRRELEQELATAKAAAAAEQAVWQAARLEWQRTDAAEAAQADGINAVCDELQQLLRQVAVNSEKAPAALLAAVASLREQVEQRDRRTEQLQAKLRQFRSRQQQRQAEQEQLRRRAQELTLSLAACRSQRDELERTAEAQRMQLRRLTGGESAAQLLRQTETALTQLRQAQETAERQAAAAQAAYLDSRQQLAVRQAQLNSLADQQQALSSRLAQLLASLSFASAEAAAAACLDEMALAGRRQEIKAYREKEQQLTARCGELGSLLDGRRISPEQWQRLSDERQAAAAAREQALTARIALERDLTELAARCGRWQQLEEELTGLRRQNAHLTTLRSLLRGNAMVEFMAQEQMNLVLVYASQRLKQLTAGRYGLELAADGSFLIRDDDNAGVKRPVNMLSGGETFQTSLALALALSTQIQLRGRHPLEFFFLDEGFGSLDQKSLETVIACLERLPLEQMTIGLISHVESLRQRLLRRLVVEPAEANGRGSRLSIEIE
ncbi:MAG: AAA family ATPase [Sporomusaceae bacterium]|nr:AAA family ATPase [Sporomusaceae bacterium]